MCEVVTHQRWMHSNLHSRHRQDQSSVVTEAICATLTAFSQSTPTPGREADSVLLSLEACFSVSKNRRTGTTGAQLAMERHQPLVLPPTLDRELVSHLSLWPPRSRSAVASYFVLDHQDDGHFIIAHSAKASVVIGKSSPLIKTEPPLPFARGSRGAPSLGPLRGAILGPPRRVSFCRVTCKLQPHQRRVCNCNRTGPTVFSNRPPAVLPRTGSHQKRAGHS